MSMPRYLCFITALLACRFPAVAAQPKAPPSSDEERIQAIARDVRKAIVTLPEFGVFDYLWFGLRENTVVLRGFASRPTLKSGAENIARKVRGVEEVKNEIEVLPLSPNDDRIRAGVYARIYGHPGIQKYTSNRMMGRYVTPAQVATGITNNPPIGFHAIHIVVKNGEVTLYGVVDNATDFAIAEMQARMAHGAFSVFNNLSVAKEEK